MATDRNQQARDEFKAAQQRAAFMRALQAGQTGLYDDLQTLIKPGQLALFSPPPNVWRWLVEEVAPDLRPGAPAGSMRLTVSVRVPLFLPAGTRIPSLLIVGEQETTAKQAQEPQAGQTMAGEAGGEDEQLLGGVEGTGDGPTGVGEPAGRAPATAAAPAGEAGGESVSDSVIQLTDRD